MFFANKGLRSDSQVGEGGIGLAQQRQAVVGKRRQNAVAGFVDPLQGELLFRAGHLLKGNQAKLRGVFRLACCTEADSLIRGADAEEARLFAEGPAENQALRYSLDRYLMYEDGRRVELLAFFEPRLRWFAK